MYFDKIQDIATRQKYPVALFKSLDSVKQTRQPHNSHVEILFDRDVDFEHKHRRIDVIFNGFRYSVDLLLKDGVVALSAVSVPELYLGLNGQNNKNGRPKVDTILVSKYINARNSFYRSKKTISDLIKELQLAEEFAFYCGEARSKTKKGQYVERLVRNKNFRDLRKLIQSFNCEQQAFGNEGFKMLAKKGVSISQEDLKVLDHLNKRKSALVICSGCLSGVVSPMYLPDQNAN